MITGYCSTELHSANFRQNYVESILKSFANNIKTCLGILSPFIIKRKKSRRLCCKIQLTSLETSF